jgi:hypothetical protein
VTLAVGALTLLLSLVLGALLSRWYFAPVRRHVAEEPLTLAELFRPTGADDMAYCPAEQTNRLHAFNGDGTRTCWTCRRTTPTAVPRG